MKRLLVCIAVVIALCLPMCTLAIAADIILSVDDTGAITTTEGAGNVQVEVTRAAGVDIHIYRSGCTIPDSTPFVSTGNVSEGLVTYEIRVGLLLTNNGVSMGNIPITWGTTTPNTTARLISSENTTDQFGTAFAIYHLRNNSTQNPSFVPTVKVGSLTCIATITPLSPSMYASPSYCTWYISCDEGELKPNGQPYYTGTKITKSGLGNKTYKSDFLDDVYLNGSGKAADGTYVSYNGISWSTTAIRTTPTPNKTIAVDNRLIPRYTAAQRYGHVKLAYNGKDYKAEDSGGAITNNRIDIFYGYGHGYGGNFNSKVRYKGINTWGTKNAIKDSDGIFVGECQQPQTIWHSDDSHMYGYEFDREDTYRLAVTIVDEDGVLHCLEMGTAVLSLENIVFIDKNTVAIEGYINPSNREYTLFSLDTDLPIASYYGYGFTHYGADIYYAQAPQHFNGNIGNCLLVKNDEIIWQTSNKVVLRDGFTMTNDSIYIELCDESTNVAANNCKILNISELDKIAADVSRATLYYGVVVFD